MPAIKNKQKTHKFNFALFFVFARYFVNSFYFIYAYTTINHILLKQHLIKNRTVCVCSRLTRIIQRRLLTVTGDAQDLRTCSPLLIRRITSFIFTMRTVLLRLYTFLTENKPRPTSFRWKKRKKKVLFCIFFLY